MFLLDDVKKLRARAGVADPEAGWLERTCSRTIRVADPKIAGMSVRECDAYALEQRDLLEGDLAEELHAELRAICDCKAEGRVDCFDLEVSAGEAGRP